jgi:hypothetical protein
MKMRNIENDPPANGIFSLQQARSKEKDNISEEEPNEFDKAIEAVDEALANRNMGVAFEGLCKATMILGDSVHNLMIQNYLLHLRISITHKSFWVRRRSRKAAKEILAALIESIRIYQEPIDTL